MEVALRLGPKASLFSEDNFMFSGQESATKMACSFAHSEKVVHSGWSRSQLFSGLNALAQM